MRACVYPQDVKDPDRKLQFDAAIRELFQDGGRVVYKGYVDDPRTTDNAWIETTAFHFHCPPEIGDKLHLGAGDDATKVVWLDVSPASESRYANLYASHREWVDRVAETFAPHEKARSQELCSPGPERSKEEYPRRWVVDDEHVDWHTAYDEYRPVDFTASAVLRNWFEGAGDKAWADADWPRLQRVGQDGVDHAKNLSERLTVEGPIFFDPTNLRPLNPRGRTGLCGRGKLGKWGPNEAVDPIVTRFHPRTNRLQVVVVRRKDTHEWALPGKMVERGEKVHVALRNAFEPKAANFRGQDNEVKMRMRLDQLFTDDVADLIVYRGYVDDPRNTDNAWIETTAVHYHCTRELAADLVLSAASKDQEFDRNTIKKAKSFINRLRPRRPSSEPPDSPKSLVSYAPSPPATPQATPTRLRRSVTNPFGKSKAVSGSTLDTDQVKWADVNEDLLLFASHKQWVLQVSQQVMRDAAVDTTRDVLLADTSVLRIRVLVAALYRRAYRCPALCRGAPIAGSLAPAAQRACLPIL